MHYTNLSKASSRMLSNGIIPAPDVTYRPEKSLLVPKKEVIARHGKKSEANSLNIMLYNFAHM